MFTKPQMQKFTDYAYLMTFKNLLLKKPCACLWTEISQFLPLQIVFAMIVGNGFWADNSFWEMKNG